MFEKQEDIFYYITVMNEFYPQPPMPDGVEEGILKGMYRYRKSSKKKAAPKAHLLGSGAILNEAIKAQELLEGTYGVSADVWSVTSYKELYRDGIDTERHNLLHCDKKPSVPFVTMTLNGEKGVFVAASDYLKVLPLMIARWIPGELIALGTDGFGRSDNRTALRNFFEVDSRHIALAALCGLARDGKIESKLVKRAMKDLEIDPDKPNPLYA
jgi:pyruvate dehydrogenase E1 component